MRKKTTTKRVQGKRVGAAAKAQYQEKLGVLTPAVRKSFIHACTKNGWDPIQKLNASVSSFNRLVG